MSRSYLYHNIVPFAGCRSEKYDKRLANRRLRRNSKKVIRSFYDPEDLMNSNFPLMREVSNIWSFGKDGHCVLITGKGIFINKEWWFEENKYYGKYVTKDGHIRK